jgi:Flp pilus assembly protein TadG
MAMLDPNNPYAVAQQRNQLIKKEQRLHMIEGAIMLPFMLLAPFIFMYVLGLLAG